MNDVKVQGHGRPDAHLCAVAAPIFRLKSPDTLTRLNLLYCRSQRIHSAASIHPSEFLEGERVLEGTMVFLMIGDVGVVVQQTLPLMTLAKLEHEYNARVRLQCHSSLVSIAPIADSKLLRSLCPRVACASSSSKQPAKTRLVASGLTK